MNDSNNHRNGCPLRIQASGLTDVGLKRQHNEDSIEVNKRLRLFIVADGMGGHAAGEVASKAAIETVLGFVGHVPTGRDFSWPFGTPKPFSLKQNILHTAVHLANLHLCQLSNINRRYDGMGTTMVAVYAPFNRLHIAHVGDSRVYRLRMGRLEQLTSDHSWVNEQLKRNVITEEEARSHRWRNIITRALGSQRANLEVDLCSVELQADDMFLLCSDGLTGMVDDVAITQILNQDAGNLDAACEALIATANEAGGQDNISVVVLRVDSAVPSGSS